jgi:threonine/homoserine/homoserine lactone efflux protein
MIATLAGFTLAATLLILAPGPDSLLVMRNSIRGGRRTGWITAAGTLSGLTVWAAAAALGLSALLQASRLGYTVLRFAGAAYLIWLGVTSLRSHHRTGRHPRPQREPTLPEHQPAALPEHGLAARRAYVNGLVSNLCNPKIGVFFLAFLPGFIPTSASAIAFSLLLGGWFVVETAAWLACLAWITARGLDWIQRSAVQRWLERATGIVLIGFGVALAIETS